MKAYTVRHQCGHNDTVLITATTPYEITVEKNAALTRPCRRCRNAATAPAPLAIDTTTPAGAALTTVTAIQNGWTEAEIVAGVRFNDEPTFVCAGCGRTYPRRLAMMANLGTSCPDCYDDLAG